LSVANRAMLRGVTRGEARVGPKERSSAEMLAQIRAAVRARGGRASRQQQVNANRQPGRWPEERIDQQMLTDVGDSLYMHDDL